MSRTPKWRRPDEVLRGPAVVPAARGLRKRARAPRRDACSTINCLSLRSERIGAEDVFAVSDAMKRFLRTEVSTDFHSRGYQQGFVDALYTKGKLKLEYESTVTRNAAEAFDARAGNCLSLVIMTARSRRSSGSRSATRGFTWTTPGDAAATSISPSGTST